MSMRKKEPKGYVLVKPDGAPYMGSLTLDHIMYEMADLIGGTIIDPEGYPVYSAESAELTVSAAEVTASEAASTSKVASDGS